MALHVHSVALVLQLVALAFLILSTITTPASQLHLATYKDYSFGVFGFCSGTNACSTSVGYELSSHFTSKTISNGSTLDKLTNIFVFIPIGAGLTLISVLLNFVSQFVSAMNSSFAFWIFMTFLSLFSFAISAIGCIVAFLIFYPYIEWPCWILIPAAVLNLVSIILFGMASRTLPYLNDVKDNQSMVQEKDNTYDISYTQDNYLIPPVRTQLDLNESDNDSSSFNNKQSVNESFVDMKSSVYQRSLTNVPDLMSNNSQSSFVASEHTQEADTSLKLPSINNPYLDTRTSLASESGSGSALALALAMDPADDRVSSQHSSTPSLDSHFTSISQRGINPRYYTNAPNKPNLPGVPQNTEYTGQGYRGPPPQQGYRGPPQQGYRGAPPPPQGYRGPPPQGYRGPPPQQGYRGPPPQQGYRGAPPPQGFRGPPQQGYRGLPQQGYRGPPPQGYNNYGQQQINSPANGYGATSAGSIAPVSNSMNNSNSMSFAPMAGGNRYKPRTKPVNTFMEGNGQYGMI
ncbi:Tos7 protein [Martiniozyma asiatica (nom. inval.)]|nr:Tos7 protein [Martiniozyma asiatica]